MPRQAAAVNGVRGLRAGVSSRVSAVPRHVETRDKVSWPSGHLGAGGFSVAHSNAASRSVHTDGQPAVADDGAAAPDRHPAGLAGIALFVDAGEEHPFGCRPDRRRELEKGGLVRP